MRYYLGSNLKWDDLPCLEWYTRIDKSGYARTRLKNKTIFPHRYSYELFIGTIENEIDHLCKNRKCWNPWHLEDVTHQENMHRGKYGSATHCIHGHELNKDNLYIYPKTSRQTIKRACRKCHS